MLRERGLYLGEDYERVGGLYVPPAVAAERAPRRVPVAVDLFAGAGGMSLGFHSAGLHVIAASEAWHHAAQTYLLNLAEPETVVHVLGFVPDKMATKADRLLHEKFEGESISAQEFFEYHGIDDALPGDGWISEARDHEPGETYCSDDPLGLPCEHLFLGDVRGLTGEYVLSAIDLPRGEVDVVAGGPPCQGYSVAGRRQVEDPRNSLVFDFMRLVIEIHPKTFAMENVPGIVSMVTPEGVPVLDALARIAEDGGFGAYDAIKRSLQSTAGLGAVMRGTKSSRKDVKPSDDDEAEFEDDQLDLFAGAAA